MNIIKTNFKAPFDSGESFVVYITNKHEIAEEIHKIHNANKAIKTEGWYYSVQTVKVCKDCRVPEFFHDGNYWATIITHNKGDWNDKHNTYELYIAE
jgi:hypothetical protein